MLSMQMAPELSAFAGVRGREAVRQHLVVRLADPVRIVTAGELRSHRGRSAAGFGST